MKALYADIIIDISQSNLDRPFCYRIPEELTEKVSVGSVVEVPFGKGNSKRTGYVIGITDHAAIEEDRIKDILSAPDRNLNVEGKLIKLAEWMKQKYNSTMITALKTVMPVKEKVRERKTDIDSRENIPVFEPVEELEEEQTSVINDFINDLNADKTHTYLLHGVTGSGKTEVYIKLAEEVIKRGKDVIVLVPEIALTFQTVARFSSYFQDSIAILNSKLSKGEKYREFVKVREGETHIMIGPRSALFAPFPNLGLIIIDEEHDISYKSEKTPKYHAREVAIERAGLEGASVVLGSATPSISSYRKAELGEYKLYSLKNRVKGATLPEVEIVDLREELRMGNRSIISNSLYEKLKNAFDRKEQAMLFINRRGYNSFVSCRECGEVVKCPRCDVSLSLHGNSKLMCHYCGYVQPMVNSCPKCSSKLIGGYGTGTEKLEEEINKLFPKVKTLRMDKDTTARKGAHGRIIAKFREGKADCLIGTQMIVKGHDFPKVTVVGNILADMGLFDTDYESAERTFDLITQAAGRAGRDKAQGNVVVQTYQPDNYAIKTAASQDYEAFYKYEMAYREMLRFPPVYELLGIMVSSGDEQLCSQLAEGMAKLIKEKATSDSRNDTSCIGPAEAVIYRINEIYRKVIYVKSKDYNVLVNIAGLCDRVMEEQGVEEIQAEVQYDFNPIRIY
ncbi:MAG: primosomal protein N' [Eubacterium sp.]|nr:primosomal protein N' [Eubacterium sp.]